LLTAIEGGYIIAFDGEEHRLLKNGVVVIEEDKIKHVGKTYTGYVNEKIDARGKLVSPGFINTHLHFGACNFKSWPEDAGSRQFYGTTLLEYSPAFSGERAGALTKEEHSLFAKFSIAEVLKTGNTTITEMGSTSQVDVCMDMGVRAYMGDMFSTVQGYRTTDGKNIVYNWDEEKGFKGLDKAVDFIKKCKGSYDGRIRGMYCPAEPDRMSEDLYREMRKKADELPAVINAHTAVSVHEFWACMRRYGMTPIEVVDSFGVLKSDVIIGHGVFITGHSKTLHPYGDDLEIIAKRGCTVSNHPTTFAMRGTLYEAYSDYLERGINCTIGTDIRPFDVIREARWAAVLCKCVKADSYVGTAGNVYDSLTLAGAKALNRNDLGRISPGAKADITIINLKSVNMIPIRDPIKNLIYYGHTSDVDSTFVDGKKLVEDGKVIGLDEEKLLEQIQKVTMRLFDKVPEEDWAHRTADQMAPQTIKPWKE
jgi:cytosine/adenosine deaminase-related metal-dependent hydrolase